MPATTKTAAATTTTASSSKAASKGSKASAATSKKGASAAAKGDVSESEGDVEIVERTSESSAIDAAASETPAKEAKKKSSTRSKKTAEAPEAPVVDFGSDNDSSAPATIAAGEKKRGRPAGSKNKSKADADASASAAAAATTSEDSSAEEAGTAAKARPKRATKKEIEAKNMAAIQKLKASQDAALNELCADLGVSPIITDSSASADDSGAAGKKGKKPRAPTNRKPAARKPVDPKAYVADALIEMGVVGLQMLNGSVIFPTLEVAKDTYSVRAVINYESDDVATVNDYLTEHALEEMPVLGDNECFKVIKDGETSYVKNDEVEISDMSQIVEKVVGSYFDRVPEKASDLEKFNNFKTELYRNRNFTSKNIFSFANFVFSNMRKSYPDETRSTIEVEKKLKNGDTEMVASGHHFQVYGTPETKFFHAIIQEIQAAAESGNEKILEKVANMRSREVTRTPSKKAAEKAAEKGKPLPEAHSEYVEGIFPEGDSFTPNQNVPLTFLMQALSFMIDAPHGETMEMEMDDEASATA